MHLFAATAPHALERVTQGLGPFASAHAGWAVPLLGLALAVLVAFVAHRGMQSDDQDGWHRAREKEAVLRFVRGRVVATPEAAAQELGIDPFRVKDLLVELEEEGKLVRQTVGRELAGFRIKGAL